MHPKISPARAFSLCVVCLSLALPGTGLGEEFMVTVGDAFFNPASLTIQAGDSVTWTNQGSLPHNARADDGSFRCANGCDGMGGSGVPSSAPWSFTLTFDTPGTIPYYCEVHGGPGGIGMAGQIIVEQSTSQPGNLRFSMGSYSVGEAAGSVTVTVNRIGGDDGQVMVSYATSNGSAQAGSDYTARSGMLQWANNDDNPKSFQVPILDDSADESNETFSVMLSSPTGGAGLASPSTATVTINDDDQAPAPNPGTIGFTAADFGVDEDGGSATVTAQRTGGSDGLVDAAYATSDGSAEADVDYEPTSGSLTWSDGETGSKSFEVPILDDAAEEGNETVNLALSSPSGGANLGLSSATLTIRDDDRQMGSCTPDDDTLCLNQDGRFRVEVRWRNAVGATGNGQAVDIGRRDSGLFYFFQSDNIEMLVKVLDACDLAGFNTFWVFMSAVTDVEFTLTITDTEADRVREYTNVLGHPADPVFDTAAFETCP